MVADMGTERGSANRLAEVYERSAPAGFRLAYVLTGDRALAEDLVQDAFLRFVGRLHHLRDPEAFAQLLRREPNVRDPKAWVWAAAFKIADGELRRPGFEAG